MAERPPLSPAEARRILRDLSAMKSLAVLVGGQAVAAWINVLRQRYPEISAEYLTTSKDIDFVGGKDAVYECATILDGKAYIPDIDHMTPNSGQVVFVDQDGFQREIDFLWQPLGLDADDVKETAIEVNLLTPEGDTIPVRVMHPERVLESKIVNVQELRRGDDLSRQQVRAAIVAARYFSRFLLDERNDVEAVLALNERIFRFCMRVRSTAGAYGLDPFAAVLDDERLPEKFHTKRYPRMKAQLGTRRERSFRNPTVLSDLTSLSGMISVHSYTRRNGTRVRGHYRRP